MLSRFCFGFVAFILTLFVWVDLMVVSKESSLAYHNQTLTTEKDWLRREFFKRLGGDLS